MALLSNTIIDSVEILEMGQLQCRQRTDIYDDANPAVIISSAYERWTLNPGDSMIGQDAKVIAITTALWTAEVIAAYKAYEAANRPGLLSH